MPPWPSPLWLVKEKNYAIWHFGLSRSLRKKNWQPICEAVNAINIEYFYDNFFHFKRKFLPLLILQGLFRSKFTPNPGDVFNWSLLVNAIQFHKRRKACDKKWIKRKKCSWSYQRSRTPLSKRVSNTSFFRFRIRATLVIEFFFY